MTLSPTEKDPSDVGKNSSILPSLGFLLHSLPLLLMERFLFQFTLDKRSDSRGPQQQTQALGALPREAPNPAPSAVSPSQGKGNSNSNRPSYRKRLLGCAFIGL